MRYYEAPFSRVSFSFLSLSLFFSIWWESNTKNNLTWVGHNVSIMYFIAESNYGVLLLLEETMKINLKIVRSLSIFNLNIFEESFKINFKRTD